MTDLASGYEPKSFESRLYAEWEASGCFRPSGKGEPYAILLPPPNVTGTLHMGHAFQHTLQDALVRYHRMRGFDVLWQMGSDHAGIATEMVVSRNLSRENLTRDGLGREGFVEKVWEWQRQSGGTIEQQMRRLGTSGDWSRSVFTMDPMPSKAVVEAFVRLHEEGLIYRGQRLVNWDPVLKTAISDLEVESVEEDGFLWSIRYPLADGSGSVVVVTTRPETMLGDAAVMVHPEDGRYAHLVGRMVRLPLTDREIPVIADSYVDREFGTGVVKVTPAHDFNDYQVGMRHRLPLINIFTDDAAINGLAPEKYRGLDRYQARKIVLEDLEALGLLVETRPHKLQAPRGDRTGQVIEPYLTDQWFIRMDELGRRGLALFDDGRIRFVPPNWINTYRHWMENLQDWCISRQLWWGHRIPAWYDGDGNIYVARTEQEARTQAAQKNGGTAPAIWRRDNDVLETWFSSALWPFSTMGWPDAAAMQERGYDRYLPGSVLVTGFDIIFFWVARMVMMTDHFTGRVPFKDVYITGLVRDKDGQKMSKSKGNILDPIDIIDGVALDELLAKRTLGLMRPQDAPKIEKVTRKDYPDGIAAHGADALRFTMAALAGPGRDIKFDLSRCEGYKNFCNKLWNATRFVLMNTQGASFPGIPQPRTDAEKWILARLDRVTAEAQVQFAAYRFDLLAQALYEFAWNEFCDWFVELAKPALNGSDSEAAASTRHTLLYVLEALLRLLHPLIPFVTETLWRQVVPHLDAELAGKLAAARLGNGAAPSISLRAYPVPDRAFAGYGQAETDVEWLKAMVSALRRVRSELGVSPSKTIRLLLRGGGENDSARLDRFESQLRFLLKLESIEWLRTDASAPASATAMVGELRLLVPLEGLVDLDAERARMDKEIRRVDSEIAKCNGKLGNPTFVQNAPAAVVEQERVRLLDWNNQLAGLKEQRQRLG
ncbi:MAG: valine--tRNA ligase [Xanthomonadaceae bacterium]|nr:valine--tRNA ligase [Xanthomonadaceae bacterium]